MSNPLGCNIGKAQQHSTMQMCKAQLAAAVWCKVYFEPSSTDRAAISFGRMSIEPEQPSPARLVGFDVALRIYGFDTDHWKEEDFYRKLGTITPKKERPHSQAP